MTFIARPAPRQLFRDIDRWIKQGCPEITIISSLYLQDCVQIFTIGNITKILGGT